MDVLAQAGFLRRLQKMLGPRGMAACQESKSSVLQKNNHIKSNCNVSVFLSFGILHFCKAAAYPLSHHATCKNFLFSSVFRCVGQNNLPTTKIHHSTQKKECECSIGTSIFVVIIIIIIIIIMITIMNSPIATNRQTDEPRLRAPATASCQSFPSHQL